MKTRIIISTLLIVLSSLTWMSCKGPMGPAGYDGRDGLDGNANVTASKWFTPTTWAGQTGDWYFDVSSSAITKDIVETGAVLAYVSLPGDLYNDFTVRPLPAYALNSNWDFLLPNDNNTSYGKIEFTSDMTNMPGTNGYNFRFIIIEAGYLLKSTKLKSTKMSDLKTMPYKDVCKLLGIQE